jgi:kinesin family protein 5
MCAPLVCVCDLIRLTMHEYHEFSLRHPTTAGFDVCMFAYGPSGSGKSFSMTGAGPDCALKLQGIIPRISRDVFQRTRSIGDNDPNIEFKITASMLEIYVDKIYDLLIPANEYNIATRPHLDMQMSNVKGLSQCPVNSERDVTALLVRGFQNQYKAPTGTHVCAYMCVCVQEIISYNVHIFCCAL